MTEGTGTPEDEPLRGRAIPSQDLDRVPPALREALNDSDLPPQIVSMTLAAYTASYQGPLPPAEQFRAYEEVLPGSADRLLAMAERQQAHRHKLEEITVTEAASRSRWGLRLGFVIAVLVIALGAVAIFTGHALAGFGVIVAQAAVLAGVFVYGRRDQHKELVEKAALTQLPSGGTAPEAPSGSSDRDSS